MAIEYDEAEQVIQPDASSGPRFARPLRWRRLIPAFADIGKESMGDWGFKPWENDSGADWFGDMFDATELRPYVRRTLEESDIENDHQEIRAAASLLLLLGHTYVWPIDHIDSDLELAAKKLEQIIAGPLADEPEFIGVITSEIQELRSRIAPQKEPPSAINPKKWWEFWK